MLSTETMKRIGDDISKATNNHFSPTKFSTGSSGGGGATVGIISDNEGVEYFTKKASLYNFNMLNAEFEVL